MPGRCPSCNQIYADESQTFCPNDGLALVREAPGAYNAPPPGMGAQPPAGGYPPPPPQGGYYPGQQAGTPPPPGWQQQPPPYGQQPPPPYGQQQQYGAPPPYGAGVTKTSKMPLIIGLLALVLIGGGVGLYFLLKGDSTETTDNTNSPTVTSSPGATPRLPSTTTPSTTTTTTTTTRTYTEDEKHRLLQAVGVTGDTDLMIEVAHRIGITDAKGNQYENFEPFRQAHVEWARRNQAWVKEYRDKAKARAYVMANK